MRTIKRKLFSHLSTLLFSIIIAGLLPVYTAYAAMPQAPVGTVVPAYNGQPYVVINNNIPFFSAEELALLSIENDDTLLPAIDSIVPFETLVSDYEATTKNHVLYRTTPIVEDSNLVASGVLMEAFSVEDQGKGICLNLYFYNVTPDTITDYSTGASTPGDPIASAKPLDLASTLAASNDTLTTISPTPSVQPVAATPNMVWQSATGKKYHAIDHCGNMNPKKAIHITLEEALTRGLEPCSKCY